MNEKQLLDSLQPVIGFFGDSPYIKALVVFLLSLAVANLSAVLITRVVRRITQRTRNNLDDTIIVLLHRPLFWSVILIGSMAAISLMEFSEGFTGSLRAALATVMVLIWSQFLYKVIRIILQTLSARAKAKSLIRPQTLPLFSNLALLILLALSIYLIFNAWNIDMTAWLASAGIAGIAIGFAAKDTLANLFSGVFILADSPYKISDYVVLESGERGKVTHIGIRSTRILTRDDVEVTIPNSIMGNTRIVNESGGPHEKYRIRVKVGVAYGTDIDRVSEILMDIAAAETQVCDDPEPRVRFRTFGGSGLDFELLCWIENPELRGRVIHALNTAVYKRFMSDGIEIPYTKQDLYIKQLPE